MRCISLRVLTNVNKKFFWSVLVITLAAFALRVFRLDAQSFWWDEVMPVAIAQLPFPQWWEPVFQDRGYPPGLYFLLTAWSSLGVGEFYLRYVSVICGTLSVAVMAQLGARVSGGKSSQDNGNVTTCPRRGGAFAAALMAVSPFYIWYSQELRMYAPLILATVASSWAFLTLLYRPRWQVALGLFLCDVFGLYLHYLFGIFLISQLLFWVMARGRYPRALRFWVAATAAAGVLFIPWLLALQLSPIHGHPNLGWIPNARWYDPALSLYAVVLGASQDPNFILNWVTPLGALALAIYGTLSLWKSKARSELRYLLTWLLAPWLLLFFLSIPISGRSLYVDRYLSPFIPPLLILIAAGALAFYQRNRALLGAVAVIALTPLVISLWNMYFVPRYARDDWRGLLAYVHENADSIHDAVLVDLSLELPFGFYNRSAVRVIEHPFPQDENIGEWMESQQDWRMRSHLWLVTTALPINVHRFYPDAQGQLAFAKQDAFKNAMDARFAVEQEKWFPGLVLTKYRVQPRKRAGLGEC